MLLKYLAQLPIYVMYYGLFTHQNQQLKDKL